MHLHALFSVASILTTAAAIPTFPSSSNTLHLSTTRRNYKSESGNVLPEVLTLFNNTLKKYTSAVYVKPYAGLSGTNVNKRQTIDPLTDQCNGQEDLLYHGPIQIRGKTFTIDFDTGSADLFIPGANCTTAAGCPGSNKYDGQGKDLGNTTSVTYGSGQISGRNYLDTVSIGNLSADNTNVIALSNAQGFNDSNADGLMGMGFSTIAKSKQPTFVEKLISEGKISQKEFCFYLGRCLDNTGANSQLSIGGRSSSKYSGSFTAVPVKSQDYWRVNVDSASSGIVPIPVSGEAAIDTGTTAVVASGAYALPINEAMGGVPIPLGGSGSLQLIAYAIQCNATTLPSFTMGGKSFAINAKDISLGTVDLPLAEFLGHAPLISKVKQAPAATLCLSSVLQADIGPTMNPPVANFNIIGDSFLKNWYSCYSYDAASGKPAVLFAKSV